MIDINLIPENLRKKAVNLFTLNSSRLPMDVVIGVIGLFLFALIGTHVLLLGSNIFKVLQYKHYQGQLVKIKQDKDRVDIVINDMRSFQAKIKSIEDITSGKALSWSEKLNIISECIVKGVWLTKIELSENTLLIEGRALSRKNEQMINAHNFAANLKSNERFLQNLENLEISSIQLQKIGDTEIANFLITCQLK